MQFKTIFVSINIAASIANMCTAATESVTPKPQITTIIDAFFDAPGERMKNDLAQILPDFKKNPSLTAYLFISAHNDPIVFFEKLFSLRPNFPTSETPQWYNFKALIVGMIDEYKKTQDLMSVVVQAVKNPKTQEPGMAEQYFNLAQQLNDSYFTLKSIAERIIKLEYSKLKIPSDPIQPLQRIATNNHLTGAGIISCILELGKVPDNAQMLHSLSEDSSTIGGKVDSADDKHILTVTSIAQRIAPCARFRSFSEGTLPPRILSALPLQDFVTINISLANTILSSSYEHETLWGDILRVTDYLGSDHTLIIAAAGNESASLTNTDPKHGIQADHYVGVSRTQFQNLIIVGAIDKDNNLAEFSNFPGTFKDLRENFICARGDDMITLGTTNETYLQSGEGTSFAAPIVTGCINLLQQLRPDLTNRDIKEIILSTATRTFKVTPLKGPTYWVYDKPQDLESGLRENDVPFQNIRHLYGRGILNLEKAIEVAKTYKLPTKEKM
jgi:Subtilase family